MTRIWVKIWKYFDSHNDDNLTHIERDKNLKQEFLFDFLYWFPLIEKAESPLNQEEKLSGMMIHKSRQRALIMRMKGVLTAGESSGAQRVQCTMGWNKFWRSRSIHTPTFSQKFYLKFIRKVWQKYQRFVPSIGSIEKAMKVFNCLG